MPDSAPSSERIESASCSPGIEALAARVELLDPVALEHRDQLGVDETHALGEVLLVVPGRGEGTLEVVHHGQQLADEPALRALARERGFLRRPLAVVLEIGLGPAGEVEVLVTLPLHGCQRVVRVDRLLRRARSSGLGPLRRVLFLEELLLVRGILLPGGLAGLVA